MDKRIEKAINAADKVVTTPLSEFARQAITRDNRELAETVGTSGAILVSQFILYARSQMTLRETHTFNEIASENIINNVWRARK